MLCVFHPLLHARTDSCVIGPVSYRTRVHALQWSSFVPQRCHCTKFLSPANRAFVAWLKDRVVFAKRLFHLHVSPMMSHSRSSSSSCLHMSVQPSSLSLPYPRHQPLRSRCRSINTAQIYRMRSMDLWPKQPLLQVTQRDRQLRLLRDLHSDLPE